VIAKPNHELFFSIDKGGRGVDWLEAKILRRVISLFRYGQKSTLRILSPIEVDLGWLGLLRDCFGVDDDFLSLFQVKTPRGQQFVDAIVGDGKAVFDHGSGLVLEGLNLVDGDTHGDGDLGDMQVV